MFALFNLGGQELIILLVIGSLISCSAGLPVLLVGYLAWQARQRGYSFVIWFLACIVTLNPILILIVLAVLPDAHKQALRRQEMAELEAKLAARAGGAAPVAGHPVSPLSVGDQSTVAPPALRSVGDEETRA
jgi:hypothetical protein